MALFVSGGIQMTIDTFVEFGGLLKTGHATQSQCYAAGADVIVEVQPGGLRIV